MKVGIISPDCLFRRALISMLTPKLCVAWGIGRIHGQRQPPVDVIIVDAQTDNLDAGAIADLTREQEGAKVALLYRHPNDELVVQSLLAGAQGCLSLQQDIDTFMAAMEALARGELWAPRRCVAMALERSRENGHVVRNGSYGISKREWEVLTLVATGQHNKEIATKLYISEQTVKRHLYSVFRKLNVGSRLAAGLRFYEIKASIGGLLAGFVPISGP